MGQSIIWAPLAKEDLRALFVYIADQDPSAAHRLASAIIAATKRLEDFPQSGRVVPEFGWESLREIIVRPYRIIYRLSPEYERIEVVRIWHSARGHPIIT